MLGHRFRSSFLDDLVFYSGWRSGCFLDIVRGKLALDVATPVPPSDLTPCNEVAGRYLPGANSLVFSGDDVSFGDSAFSIGMWIKPLGTMDIFRKSDWTAGIREYDLAISNTDIPNMRICRDGTNFTSCSGPSVKIGMWNCLVIRHDPVQDKVYFDVNGVTKVDSCVGGVFRGVSSFDIGVNQVAGGGNGSIGPIAVWKRLLSDKERMMFYNRGLGIKVFAPTGAKI
jgi:hypothetical protein